jgi:pyruvate/2-oxoglutarate dehydrogenase complex dihydrolipoamide acyltransferase (E2) component
MKPSDSLNSDWRKVASTIYKKPVDSKVFGQSEIDVTELENFISNKRKEGLKITLTHVFALILARSIKNEIPELNAFLRRGKIIARPSIDAMISVLQADGGMGSALVSNADSLSLTEIEQVLREEINKSRKGNENESMQTKNLLTSFPWPIRNWIFKIYTTLTIRWGISVPWLGLSPQTFGSFVLTNIGSVGLDTGYPALLPSSNVAFVFVMGGIQKKPVVVNDKIVIRRMMSITVVIDHRIADASHGGKLLRYIKGAVRKPEELL